MIEFKLRWLYPWKVVFYFDAAAKSGGLSPKAVRSRSESTGIRFFIV